MERARLPHERAGNGCGDSDNSETEPDSTEFESTPARPPRMIAFTKHRECLVGLPAKQQAVVNAQNAIFAFKRLIGRKFQGRHINGPDLYIPHTCQHPFLPRKFPTHLHW